MWAEQAFAAWKEAVERYKYNIDFFRDQLKGGARKSAIRRFRENSQWGLVALRGP